MVELYNLTSAGKSKKRTGRGGSRGGTSGRGHKGQKARSGGSVDIGFEGGQMPLYRRIPKRGFTNARFRTETHIVDVGRLEAAFNDGQTVTRESLAEKGLIKDGKSSRPSRIKILGNAEVTKKLVIHADACSKAARGVIEKVGGEVKLTRES